MFYSIDDYKITCNLHRHALPRLIYIDNPKRDKGFFVNVFPSLRDYSTITSNIINMTTDCSANSTENSFV